jgi:acyl-CoA thioesterase FadM
MYLAEEAVLKYFRERGCGPHQLYHEYGLCFEIVDSAVRIFYPLNVDDIVRITVQAESRSQEDDEMTLAVRFFVDRNGVSMKSLSGKVKVLLRTVGNNVSEGKSPMTLVPYIHHEIIRVAKQLVEPPPIPPKTPGVLQNPEDPSDMTSDEAIMRRLVQSSTNAFIWKWRIPYYYCHYWDRIQHSGYVALLEEVVPLFLADRGISIRTMLETRGWIPVVSSAQVEILREALMEETLYTVYTVEEVFKDLTYTARMDCYVPRNGTLLHTATGRIVHGSAQIRGRQKWELARFDATSLTALRGNGS